MRQAWPSGGDLAGSDSLREARAHLLDQRLDDLGVEAGAAAGLQLDERLVQRHRAPIRAAGDEAAEGVAGGDDPGSERDEVALEPVRIARAVEALVRRANQGRRRAEGW